MIVIVPDGSPFEIAERAEGITVLERRADHAAPDGRVIVTAGVRTLVRPT